MKEYFFCYSPPLASFLKSQGFVCITCALHRVTKDVFWEFKKSPELDAAIILYNEKKSKEEKSKNGC